MQVLTKALKVLVKTTCLYWCYLPSDRLLTLLTRWEGRENDRTSKLQVSFFAVFVVNNEFFVIISEKKWIILSGGRLALFRCCYHIYCYNYLLFFVPCSIGCYFVNDVSFIVSLLQFNCYFIIYVYLWYHGLCSTDCYLYVMHLLLYTLSSFFNCLLFF